MSDALARLRVTETHGIRRFLYPLTAEVHLPEAVPHPEPLCLMTGERQAVPIQVTPLDTGRLRVDFAVSLAPGATEEYHLMPGQGKVVEDPLQISLEEGESLLHNRQQRFEISLLPDTLIGSVIYDGKTFLRGPLRITRNGEEWQAVQRLTASLSPASVTLNAWAELSGRYSDGSSGSTKTTLTACKSWAGVTHRLRKSKPGDEVTLTLPLAVTAPILTYDLGLEGVYGKIEAKNRDSVTWRMDAHGKSGAQWAVETNGRTDYTGTLTGTEFRRKRWLHLVDSSQSLAIAITQVPRHWKRITVTLGSDGNAQVAFKMTRRAEKDATFGVCYHFLNDVPAIAAATNPQSILLPPTVEVLPAL